MLYCPFSQATPKGEFTGALGLTQDMLRRVEDEDTRMRRLLNVLDCSTQLCLDEVRKAAIAELDGMRESESRGAKEDG